MSGGLMALPLLLNMTEVRKGERSIRAYAANYRCDREGRERAIINAFIVRGYRPIDFTNGHDTHLAEPARYRYTD